MAPVQHSTPKVIDVIPDKDREESFADFSFQLVAAIRRLFFFLKRRCLFFLFHLAGSSLVIRHGRRLERGFFKVFSFVVWLDGKVGHGQMRQARKKGSRRGRFVVAALLLEKHQGPWIEGPIIALVVVVGFRCGHCLPLVLFLHGDRSVVRVAWLPFALG